jgi:hypothetical protein
MGPLCCKLARGVCISIFAPPAEMGGTKQEIGVVERRGKSRVLLWRLASQMAPDRTYALRVQLTPP